VYVVNTLGASVERFAPDGSPVRSYPLPAADQGDAALRYVDLAFAPGGDLLVLEVARRVVVRVPGDGDGAPTVIPVPLRRSGPFLPTGLACDGGGRVAVYDGYEGNLLRFDLTGKALGTFKSDAASTMVCDGRGRFYGTRCPSLDSAKSFEIVREDPASGQRAVVATINSPVELSSIFVRGVDGRGNVYLEWASGTTEVPNGWTVAAWSPEGQKLGSGPSKGPSADLTMVRPRAVAPDGTIWLAQATERGLELSSVALSR
jgi:sugar lactone lactonase YvrE